MQFQFHAAGWLLLSFLFIYFFANNVGIMIRSQIQATYNI